MRLLPLFLVSATAVGLETALTRYFALANWSDYGYWVISIVMAGFAFSGVTLALADGFLPRHSAKLFAVLPALLTLSAALGYCGVVLNPFNPLALQNQATWLPQLQNIGLYYLALLPFFYLTGLFISLCFCAATERLGKVYAADMLGAGAGTLLVLGLMYIVPAFALTACLLPLLALTGLCTQTHRKTAATAAVLALILGEALLAFGPQAALSQYKPIYPPLHTPNAKVLATLHSPRGEYMLLDDFTERVNTDISNDSAMLGYPGPPRAYGLYRDGIRIASLPLPGALISGYAPGALDGLPYVLRPHPTALLIGASGGFKPAEVLALGAAHVDVLEPEPVLYHALTQGLGASPPLYRDLTAQTSSAPPLRILKDNPRAAVLTGQRYDIIDIASDFLDSAPANVYAVSAQAFAADLNALTPGGMLSVPVSIQDFPAYALRLLATMREAYRLRGINDAGPYVIMYRSAWNVRLLASNTPFSAADIKTAAKWTDDRSFDTSYYKGFDPIAARDNLYNDLPAVSFTDGTANETAMDDSIADEAAGILAGQPTVSSQAFDLRPVTDDRPAFYAILRLNQLSLLLKRLQILPQAEIGALVNLAVLAQAGIIAALVLLLPLAAPRRAGSGFSVPRPALYFSALALAYMFLEIFAIERVSLFLNDRATAFSLVLSVLLAFSGLGSFCSGRFAAQPGRAVFGAFAVIAAWGGLMYATSGPAVLAGSALPYALRVALAVLVLAPVSFAMGMPFPLGLERIRAQKFFLPWAWGLNGALSVVAPPLANLLLRNIGLHAVLGGAILLYAVATLSLPVPEGKTNWLPVLRRSAAAD